ncbi:MAG TPA: CYTH domain-containing protein [Candidatus Dojkabacteria bacterium]|nr:CYTH domain-containing protein [Candidatus Dojkabacteria bacterium]
MTNEYEAKAIRIDKDKLRKKLKKLGAKLIFKEIKYIRKTFDLPKGVEIDEQGSKWIRLRTDGQTITLTLKITSSNINNIKEIDIIVDDFEKTSEFLTMAGFRQRNLQENLRERWLLNNVEIDIDTWPMIDPYVEVEGQSEDEVKKTFEILGFDYSKAYIGSSDVVYKEEYGIDILSMPILKFD